MSVYLVRIFATILFLSVAVAKSPTQSGSDAQAQQGVVLTALFQPVYPPLARQTRIIGDVELTLKVKQDGGVEPVNVVSGHPLLRQAAVDGAKQSRFECQKCGDETLSYQMVYSFQLIGGESCCSAVEPDVNAQMRDQRIPRVVQSANHVTVVDRVTCICDPAIATAKVRSIRCLYLWKCAVHFL
jgi:TonB family protein